MKINKNYIKLIILFALTISTKAHAVCDFKTAEYIDELESPNSIKSIKIDIPNARSYIKNFLEILTSGDKSIIPDELKKNFNAKINISYIFGNCSYEGTV